MRDDAQRAALPDLLIRFSRKRDGSTVLRCERADGSVTWQRRAGRQAGFFAAHDLGHYAVETVLGLRYGFYGLLAAGWNITDFGTRDLGDDARPEATLAEHVAGLLDQERGTGHRMHAHAFNAALAAAYRAQGAAPPRRLTDGDLHRIRQTRAALERRWHALPPGDTLDLPYPAA